MCLTIATLFPRNFPFLSLSFSTPFLASFFSHECFEQDGKTKEKKLPIHVFSFYFPLLTLAAGERPYRHNKQALGTHIYHRRPAGAVGTSARPHLNPIYNYDHFHPQCTSESGKPIDKTHFFVYLKPRREI